ncbi:MAG: hypothetical protein RLZZ346_401 [Cyanobacteriota bacterium]|jgi:hypothetical protein
MRAPLPWLTLGRFGLRALRITASTATLVELLRQEWGVGISAAVAWLLFLQVERRLAARLDSDAFDATSAQT